jgi:hypothetical protein
MQCDICGSSIDIHREGFVATTDDKNVHVTCADREAIVAWARCQRCVLLNAALLTCIALALLPVLGVTFLILIVIPAGIVTHVLIHRHWWRILAFRARKVLRAKF